MTLVLDVIFRVALLSSFVPGIVNKGMHSRISSLGPQFAWWHHLSELTAFVLLVSIV